MIVRTMTEGDLPALIEVQQAGAIVGLSEVFPQDRYPFPREAILARWRAEIDDPEIETYVAVDDSGRLVGFAATTGAELLHFGTATDTWGGGVATELHDIVVARLRARVAEPRLFVIADNGRGRRFYEKLGWQPTGSTTTGNFPPHPLLLEYALPGAGGA